MLFNSKSSIVLLLPVCIFVLLLNSQQCAACGRRIANSVENAGERVANSIHEESAKFQSTFKEESSKFQDIFKEESGKFRTTFKQEGEKYYDGAKQTYYKGILLNAFVYIGLPWIADWLTDCDAKIGRGLSVAKLFCNDYGQCQLDRYCTPSKEFPDTYECRMPAHCPAPIGCAGKVITRHSGKYFDETKYLCNPTWWCPEPNACFYYKNVMKTNTFIAIFGLIIWFCFFFSLGFCIWYVLDKLFGWNGEGFCIISIITSILGTMIFDIIWDETYFGLER